MASSIVCVLSALLLVAATSDVVELTASNFKSRVLDSNEVWLVEFFGTLSLRVFAHHQPPGAATARILLRSGRRLLQRSRAL